MRTSNRTSERRSAAAVAIARALAIGPKFCFSTSRPPRSIPNDGGVLDVIAELRGLEKPIIS